MAEEKNFPDYPLFKGLQRPLEFMGIQGRYIYWAAGTVGGAVLGFILGYCLVGFVTGFIALIVVLAAGAALIFTRQKKGLHTKKNDHGVFIYCHSMKV